MALAQPPRRARVLVRRRDELRGHAPPADARGARVRRRLHRRRLRRAAALNSKDALSARVVAPARPPRRHSAGRAPGPGSGSVGGSRRGRRARSARAAVPARAQAGATPRRRAAAARAARTTGSRRRRRGSRRARRTAAGRASRCSRPRARGRRPRRRRGPSPAASSTSFQPAARHAERDPQHAHRLNGSRGSATSAPTNVSPSSADRDARRVDQVDRLAPWRSRRASAASTSADREREQHPAQRRRGLAARTPTRRTRAPRRSRRPRRSARRSRCGARARSSRATASDEGRSTCACPAARAGVGAEHLREPQSAAKPSSEAREQQHLLVGARPLALRAGRAGPCRARARRRARSSTRKTPVPQVASSRALTSSTPSASGAAPAAIRSPRWGCGVSAARPLPARRARRRSWASLTAWPHVSYHRPAWRALPRARRR